MKHSSPRPDNRQFDELRPLAFTLDYVDYPEGSVLIEMGNTRVLCNVSVQDEVPEWMKGRGTGWLTATYMLLPRSTRTRTPRETDGLSGRTQEIRRLIGRSLRAAVDLERLGERLLVVDCDVLQADGGTRTASISGGYVALALALRRLTADGLVPPDTLKPQVAAVSVGVVEEDVRLDLCYEEDHNAEVDLNVVMTADGRLIEVQGTAEGKPFSHRALDEMLDLARRGIARIVDMQQDALESHGPDEPAPTEAG